MNNNQKPYEIIKKNISNLNNIKQYLPNYNKYRLVI